ncbi:MAG: hypothetical protein M3442_18445 [Chloroflexota bacterium]|nr:hypothetical protein [Chloroflexota bacterium]
MVGLNRSLHSEAGAPASLPGPAESYESRGHLAGAQRLVRYDSNRVALWELNQKIRGLGPRDFAGATAGG